uniref:(northern house mosquito) hypothetical protein n=1 Tax=Culex pipiens TaxID=7175 RepID=A0A8D8GC84_CULPI
MQRQRMPQATLPPPNGRLVHPNGSRFSFAFRTSIWRSKSWTRRLRCCKQLQTRQPIPMKGNKPCSASSLSAGITLNSLRSASPVCKLFAETVNQHWREENLPVDLLKTSDLNPVQMVIRFHSLNYSLRCWA